MQPAGCAPNPWKATGRLSMQPGQPELLSRQSAVIVTLAPGATTSWVPGTLFRRILLSVVAPSVTGSGGAACAVPVRARPNAATAASNPSRIRLDPTTLLIILSSQLRNVPRSFCGQISRSEEHTRRRNHNKRGCVARLDSPTTQHL